MKITKKTVLVSLTLALLVSILSIIGLVSLPLTCLCRTCSGRALPAIPLMRARS